MARPKSNALTARESQILEILWRDGTATAESIRSRLPGEPHDSTVRTLLRLMEQKKLVTHDVEQRAFVYRPLVARTKARSKAVRSMLSQFFAGSAQSLVLQLLDDEQITPEDLKRLAQEKPPADTRANKRGRK
jgi:BlaI family transcriptional regulator, penicillinase repressor